MFKKIVLTILVSALLFPGGCRKANPKLPVVETTNLAQTVDELSYQILSECAKQGYWKLFIPALLSPERRQSFLAEEFLSRMYANPKIKVPNLAQINELIQKSNLKDFKAGAPLPPEWKVDGILQMELLDKENGLYLMVSLFRQPAGTPVLENLYQITDNTSELIQTIKDGSFKHPLQTVGEVVWEEKFDQETANMGLTHGQWEIKDGAYVAVGPDKTVVNNMAITTAPMTKHADAIFEGTCVLPKNGEAGLIIRGATNEYATYILFSASRQLTGFVLRKNKNDSWVSPQIKYLFPENVPFRFKVITSNWDYTLYIDSLPVFKYTDNSHEFKEGLYGVYVNLKGGQPVLWDNLRLAS